MAEELNELRAAIQHELELARSGDGYEAKAVADEIVERFVLPLFEPMRAKHYTPYVDQEHQGGYCFDFFAPTLARVAGAERERDLLLWLHAEAAWWLQLSRDEHEDDEILHSWSKRVAYLEARVGELHNTIGEQRAELARWRSGQRRHSWPVVESVPDGLSYAAKLVREQGTEGGDEHDRLLREASARMKALHDAAKMLIADRDRERASRQAWAEQAEKAREGLEFAVVEIERLRREVEFEANAVTSWTKEAPSENHDLMLPDVVCRCGAEVGTYIGWQEHVRSLRPCACVSDGQAAEVAAAGPLWSRPQCAVHPTGGAETATPGEWCKRLSIHVLDPDGWRRDHKPWAEPIAEDEFRRRAAWSTQAPWAPSAGPAYPDGDVR